MIRILLIILVAFLAIVGILGLVGPKDYNVSRTVEIDASKNAVFPYLKSLEKQQAWSPWAEKDPNMEEELKGTDGTVGASHHWKGNKDVGSGSQTITAIEENKMVEMDLKFLEPFESQSVAYINLDDGENGASKVTWGFKGDNDFFGRIMGNFMNMDAMIGPDFEHGLSKLKTLVESSAPKEFRGYAINEINLSATTFSGVRDRISWDNMQSFFATNFGKLFGAAADKAQSMPSALYFEWDEENKMADMAAVMAVTEPLEGFETFNISSGKALQINYYGAYEGSGEAHYAIDDYMKANNLQMNGPVWEEYVTDPGQEPDTSKWLTKITYPVK